MDADYLQQLMGPVLKKALAEVVERRPHDPVEFLAQLLYKYREDQNYNQRKLDAEKDASQEVAEDVQARALIESESVIMNSQISKDDDSPPQPSAAPVNQPEDAPSVTFADGKKEDHEADASVRDPPLPPTASQDAAEEEEEGEEEEAAGGGFFMEEDSDDEEEEEADIGESPEKGDSAAAEPAGVDDLVNQEDEEEVVAH